MADGLKQLRTWFLCGFGMTGVLTVAILTEAGPLETGTALAIFPGIFVGGKAWASMPDVLRARRGESGDP